MRPTQYSPTLHVAHNQPISKPADVCPTAQFKTTTIALRSHTRLHSQYQCTDRTHCLPLSHTLPGHNEQLHTQLPTPLGQDLHTADYTCSAEVRPKASQNCPGMPMDTCRQHLAEEPCHKSAPAVCNLMNTIIPRCVMQLLSRCIGA